MGRKNNLASLAEASSSKIPYTVEPLPDRLANRAPNSSSFRLMAPISGYAGITIRSKSFSKISSEELSPLKKPTKLGINSSVLYSRIKRLVRKKLIKKFTIEIDHSLLGISVKASVGINRDPKLKAQIHQHLLETPEVVSISEVTGRFDIIVSIYARDLEALHTVVIEEIGKIDGIQNTETFVELQKTDKDLTFLTADSKN